MLFTSYTRLYGSLELARTGALVTLIFTQLFHVFECKSEKKGLFGISILNNPALIFAVLCSLGVTLLTVYHPWMQRIFMTVPLTLEQLGRVFLYSLAAPALSSLMRLFPRQKPDMLLLPEHTEVTAENG
jgi:Ca2+-transporting ATPase